MDMKQHYRLDVSPRSQSRFSGGASAAVQPVINQVVFYPLSAFDGTMKTIAWAQAPALPGPAAEGGGETKWVVSEKFFDQLGTVLDPPLPGEETLYCQFQVLLDSAGRDDAIRTAVCFSLFHSSGARISSSAALSSAVIRRSRRFSGDGHAPATRRASPVGGPTMMISPPDASMFASNS
jgi:hypothetical protein